MVTKVMRSFDTSSATISYEAGNGKLAKKYSYGFSVVLVAASGFATTGFFATCTGSDPVIALQGRLNKLLAITKRFSNETNVAEFYGYSVSSIFCSKVEVPEDLLWALLEELRRLQTLHRSDLPLAVSLAQTLYGLGFRTSFTKDALEEVKRLELCHPDPIISKIERLFGLRLWQLNFRASQRSKSQ